MANPQSDARIVEAKLWYWQRISAMVLALCVIVHIAIMIYAVRGGLSGTEILARTRDNLGFAVFYATFVIACVVHVPIGLKRVCEDWLGMNRLISVTLTKLFGIAILFLGLRAVYGVYAG
jgi:fumarate reductase subunit C